MSSVSNYSQSNVAGYEGCPLPPSNINTIFRQLGIRLPLIVSELQAHNRMEGKIQTIERMLENSTTDRILAVGKTILMTACVAAFVLGCILISSPAMFSIGAGLILGGYISYFLTAPLIGLLENEKTERLENFLGERGSCSSFRNFFFGTPPLFAFASLLVIPHVVFPLWSAFSRHAKLENARAELVEQMTQKAAEIQELPLDQESIENLENSEKLEQLLRACNETIRIFEEGKSPGVFEYNYYLSETQDNLGHTQAAIDYLQVLKTFLQTKIDAAKSA